MSARRAAAVVAAALAAAVAVLPAPVPAGAQEGGAPRLALVEQTAWSRPDGEFRARVSADGLPADTGEVELALTVYGRVTFRSTFAATLDGEQLGSPVAVVARAWDEADPDGNGTAEVAVDLGAGGLDLGTGGGVHPVTLDLRTPASAESLTRVVTHLVVVPGGDDESPDLLAALVLPFRAPPSLTPEGGTEVSPDAEAALGVLADALDTHPDVALTLAPTPETVDALAGGTDAQVGVLDALRSAVDDRQVLGRPYVDLDLPAWVAAGLGPEAGAELTRGTDVIADQLSVRPDARTWIAGPTTTPAALAQLRDLGVDQVVLPEATLQPLDETVFNRTLTSPFTVRGETDRAQAAVAADAGLAAHFTATADPVLNAHRLLADLAVLFFDSPGTVRGVAVVAPDTWAPDAAFLDALLAGLASPASVVRPVDVDELFRDVAPAVDASGERLTRDLLPAAPAPSLAGYADRLRLTRLALVGYRSMIGPVNPRFDELERRLLVSGSEALTPEQRDDYVDAVVAAIDRETGAVQVPGNRSITITARRGRLPLTFRNDAGYPVDVTVQLDSDNKLAFPEGESFPLELAEGTTRLEVVVEARTSGTSRVEVRLTSPDGLLQLGTTRLTVRSTAVSGVGIVLSAGALVFLLAWWARHWRGTRRRRRLVGAAAPGQD
ncbi:MAG TPA: DUF6049 family protein [Acidimicrobiales bacterium]